MTQGVLDRYLKDRTELEQKRANAMAWIETLKGRSRNLTICILDTSVFCNMLDVPASNQNRANTLSTLERYLEAGHTLLLPLATVYETGNYIAQVENGDARRKAAQRFVEQVTQPIAGRAPGRRRPFRTWSR